MRLQKFLAACGVTSRRGAEAMVREGRVAVNRTTVTAMGIRVDPDHDEVRVDGRRVTARETRLYVALHKPRGYISSRSDERERPTLFDLVPREWRKLYPVGRLDRDSEGLIFLTNDGEFCLRMSHPRYGVMKVYRVEVTGTLPGEAISQLTAGVVSEGERLRAESVRVLHSGREQSRLEIHLREGKKREIRRMLGAVGVKVHRLKRVQIGPVRLGTLAAGEWRRLRSEEVRTLLKSAGEGVPRN